MGNQWRNWQLRQILVVVWARNQKYDKSPTFSITVDMPKWNFADNLPQFPTTKKSSYISDESVERVYTVPKTIEFSFILSNAVVETVKVRINAIPFIFFQADVWPFEIRTTAWRKCNQNRWHSFLWFSAHCINEIKNRCFTTDSVKCRPELKLQHFSLFVPVTACFWGQFRINSPS